MTKENSSNPTTWIFVESQRRSPNDPNAFKHLLNSIKTTPTPERFVETVSLINFHDIGQFKPEEDEYSPPVIPPEDE